MKFLVVAAVVAVGALLSSCDNKPPHYLVLCDQKDGNDWTLIDVGKKDGYIMSCTYQSPDKSQSYSRKCDANGCNIFK